MRLGELFAGYGGLGMAVEEVFGATTAWFSEFEDAPSKILAHHWPNVPNYGDVTKIDWASIEPVDIISGGSPCQDLSLAGRRKGMTEGTRSNLWESMREGIATIRPSYVVWENVRGALSAEAISELEQSEGRVGDSGNPHLRAIGRVLGDLADLGYDAEWRGLRAADVGATHNRFRVFLLAALPNTGSIGLETGRLPSRPAQEIPEPTDHQSLLSYAYNLGYERGWEARNRGAGLADHREPLTNPSGLRGERRRVHRDMVSQAGTCEAHSREWERDGHAANSGEPTDSGSAGPGLIPDTFSGGRARGSREARRETLNGAAAERASEGIAWGVYEPAVRRWERINGPAPRPTEPTGRDNGHRLSPAFVEWMMGLPSGWVTNVPGVNRNGQLKALGNGVVPQQAAAALRDMLAAFERQETAA